MNVLKKIGFLTIVLSLGLSFQACSKKNDVSTAADGAEGAATSEAQDIAEENLDDYTTAKVSVKEAKEILDNLTTVYFGYDQSSLTAQERSELKKIGAALKTLNTANISIEGHCDERGSNEYNLALGDRRARAVYDYLTNLGVDPSQLDTTSFGEERPAMTGMNEDAWSKNRRAELVKK